MELIKDTQAFPEISLEALLKLHAIVIIDVRTDEEWKSGHIAQAKHIPLNNLLSQLDTLPKDGAIVTVCASGVRSATAASLLIKQGFHEVLSLKGGMQAWKAAALPIQKEE